MSYSEVTITGFNSSPPADDASGGPTNQVKWATIKSKLFDPLRTALNLIDDRVAEAATTLDLSLVTLQAGVTTATSNVNALATTLNAASGTVMLFGQTSAPTGWAKGASLNDYALRIVTGSSGGSTGGSTAFTSIFAARTVSIANMTAHNHDFSDSSATASFSGTTTFSTDTDQDNDGGAGGGSRTAVQDVNDNTTSVTGTWTFSVTSSNPSVSSGSTWNFAVQYVDMILATKS
jgi:hypothetical protein